MQLVAAPVTMLSLGCTLVAQTTMANTSRQSKFSTCQLLLLATVAALALAAHLGRAQETGKPEPVKAMPREAKPDWEVSTVKASNPDDSQVQHITIRGRHISLLDTTVERFLLLGYGVQKSQIANLPDWAKTVRWDVDGVPDVEGEPSWKQLQGMMQSILAARFHLRLHHEQREMGVFALTVANSGSKMTPDTRDPNGWLEQRNSEDAGLHVENLKNASTEDLRAILQFYVNRPILDQTQLKGRYDLKLQWTKDDSTTPSADAPPGLFTAIQEQIGLKLEPVRAPADTLVIDAVEKPNAN